MGALHAAHLSLVKRSKRENDFTVVSIFVNPTQFGPKEDFSKYPRPFQADKKMLTRLGIDVLFHPTPHEMYPNGNSTRVRVSNLTDTLCGSPTSRGPEHFVGVATVVAKLFNIVRPTRAYFGMKDFQQVRVIEQMNEDLDLGVRIVRCPTMREPDGLAMSSRNLYLSVSERAQAPRLYRALQLGAKLLTSRARMGPRAVVTKLHELLSAPPAFRIDYIELVDAGTLTRLTSVKRPAVLAAAVFLGLTRLIDNIVIE